MLNLSSTVIQADAKTFTRKAKVFFRNPLGNFYLNSVTPNCHTHDYPYQQRRL